MPLYCYMITYYNYEDSEFLPIFHEKKYSKKEFHEICEKAFKQIKNEWMQKYNYFHPDADKIADYLVEHYGFQRLDNTLLIFNVNDIKTGYRKDGDLDNHF